MLNFTLGLSCLVFGPAIMVEALRILLAKIDERRAVGRLYRLCEGETTRKPFDAARKRLRLVA